MHRRRAKLLHWQRFYRSLEPAEPPAELLVVRSEWPVLFEELTVANVGRRRKPARLLNGEIRRPVATVDVMNGPD